MTKDIIPQWKLDLQAIDQVEEEIEDDEIVNSKEYKAKMRAIRAEQLKKCTASFKSYARDKYSYYDILPKNVPGMCKYRPNYRTSLPS